MCCTLHAAGLAVLAAPAGKMPCDKAHRAGTLLSELHMLPADDDQCADVAEAEAELIEAAPASAGPSLRSTCSQDYGSETPATEGSLQATYSQDFAAQPPAAKGGRLRATYSQDFEAEPETAEGGGQRATDSQNFQAEAGQEAGGLFSWHSVCQETAAQSIC